MDSLQAVPDDLRGFGGLLERNADCFKKIDQYAEETASDTAGFTGLMMTLIPVVEGVTALYGETLEFAHAALTKVKEELGRTAQEYEEREKQLAGVLRRIEAEIDAVRA